MEEGGLNVETRCLWFLKHDSTLRNTVVEAVPPLDHRFITFHSDATCVLVAFDPVLYVCMRIACVGTVRDASAFQECCSASKSSSFIIACRAGNPLCIGISAIQSGVEFIAIRSG